MCRTSRTLMTKSSTEPNKEGKTMAEISNKYIEEAFRDDRWSECKKSNRTPSRNRGNGRHYRNGADPD